ncbi:MAG TPA: hypothetical protein VMR75_04395 [Candidatus Saccharimonadales bacterium]|nr:hypothetical protein [Candidatus Saccharimonadales bacterium]
MNLYQFLVTTFNRFVAVFPHSIQWLVTLLVLIGLIGALIGLVRRHLIFILLAIFLVPFIVPVFGQLLHDVVQFISYLANLLHLTRSAGSS